VELLLGKKSIDDLFQEKVANQEKESVVNWDIEDNKKDVFCISTHTFFEDDLLIYFRDVTFEDDLVTLFGYLYDFEQGLEDDLYLNFGNLRRW